MKLKLTQQIIIGQKHKNYASLDRLCWLSKNLYNQALYQIKKQYNKDKTYLGYSKLYRLLYDIRTCCKSKFCFNTTQYANTDARV